MRILVIKSSINGATSQTNALIQRYLNERKAQGYQDCIIEHDVAEKPLPVLNQARFAALRGGEINNHDVKNTTELSDLLIAELKESDLLILGAPMYNLNVPTELKNWFDLVVRARETFRYTATYPQGLVENVKALVFSARGGVHYGLETDAITPYLNSVLGLMGINDVQFVYAEGLDMKPEGYEAGLANALQQLMHHIHY